MTTRKRHTREQVVGKFAQADRLLGEGMDVADVLLELQVSEQTYYRWRNQFGGLAGRRRETVEGLGGRTRPKQSCSLIQSWRRRR
jgi:transposase